MDNPVFDQKQFRFRDDDGDEAGAGWRQDVNVDDTQSIDTVYRVRFTIEETAGFAGDNISFRIERQVNGGGYSNVSAISTVVQTVASQLADGSDTTQQLSSPDTFVSPNGGQDDVNAIAGGAACDYAGSDSCEFEFSYQIPAADVSDADTIDIRIVGTDTQTVADATITVSTAGQDFVRSVSTTVEVSELLAKFVCGGAARVIVDIDNEQGDLRGYDIGPGLTDTDGGDLTVDAAAALDGTNFGLQFVINSADRMYGYKGITWTTDDIRIRWFFDPNGLAMGAGETFQILVLHDGGTFRLAVNWTFTSAYRISVQVNTDAGNVTGANHDSISDAPHWFEIHIHRSSTATSLDGYLRFWIDDVLMDDLKGLDIFDISPPDNVKFGIPFDQVDVGTSGTFYQDELIINDDGCFIGESPTARSFKRNADSTEEISEATERLLEAAGEAFIREVSSTVEISEAAEVVAVYLREIAEIIEISEDPRPVGTWLREFSETVEIGEDPRAVGTWLREIAEVVEISEDPRLIVAWLREVAETVEINEDPRPVGTWLREAAEVEEISDEGRPVGVWLREIAETVEITEDPVAAGTWLREAASTIEISEDAERLLFALLIRSVSNLVEIGEAADIAGTWLREASETEEISESPSLVGTWLREAAEVEQIVEDPRIVGTWLREAASTVEIAEAVTRILSVVGGDDFIRAVSTIVEISEATSTPAIWLREAAEAIEISDANSPVGTWLREIAEIVEISEDPALIGTWLREIAEAVEISEGASPVGTWLRESAETLEILEAVSPLGAWVRAITETVEIGDDLQRVGTWLRAADETVEIGEGLFGPGTDFIVVIDTTVELVSPPDVEADFVLFDTLAGVHVLEETSPQMLLTTAFPEIILTGSGDKAQAGVQLGEGQIERQVRTYVEALLVRLESSD